MNNQNFTIYFRKYSILLIIFFLIQLLFSRYHVLPVKSEYLFYISSAFMLVYNIFLATLISKDLKKLKIKSNLTVVAVIFFNLFGICFFLLNVIDKDRNENVSHNTQS